MGDMKMWHDIAGLEIAGKSAVESQTNDLQRWKT